MNTTSTYICTIPFTTVEKITELRKKLTKIYGPLRLRGRHSDRKSVLGFGWRKWNQNDIPWKKAETISIYLHDGTPNYKLACRGLPLKLNK